MNKKIALASIGFFIITVVLNYISYNSLPRALMVSLIASLGYYFMMDRWMIRKANH